MPTEQEFAVINYLKSVTKGFFLCTPAIARKVIELSKAPASGYVIKQRFSNKQAYENYQVIPASVEKIQEIISLVTQGHQYECFYRYECYDATGNHIASLYSINPHLFN